jgi:hypothetical protein
VERLAAVSASLVEDRVAWPSGRDLQAPRKPQVAMTARGFSRQRGAATVAIQLCPFDISSKRKKLRSITRPARHIEPNQNRDKGLRQQSWGEVSA